MIKIILATLVAVYSNLVAANPYDWKVTRVIDGDTVAVHAPWVPDPIKKEVGIRVWGVDTPEKGFRAKCTKEDLLGKAASEFTKKAIAGAKRVQVVVRDWDKYGGRILGDILLDGVSLRDQLISGGYAREYFGDAKTSWCN